MAATASTGWGTTQMLRDPSEHQEQAAVAAWLRAHGVDHFAVPNGGRRDAREASKLKAEGAVAGVADLILTDPPPARPGIVVVAIEMKKRNGGDGGSKAQREWLARHRAKPGWLAEIKDGAQEAIAWLVELGYGR